MGLLTQNQEQYYDASNSANYGDYQFVTLENIIKAFMVIHVGEGKIISKVSRTDVQFHGMRAIQELSYDVFRCVKSQEIKVPSNLKMISCVGEDGIKKNLYPTGKTANPFAIQQDDNGNYQFSNNNLIETDSKTLSGYQTYSSGSLVIDDTDTSAKDSYDVELDFQGRRYGLDPQYATQHGTFYIDYLRGFIHFSSGLANKTIVLKYVSDGLGTDAEMVVHKFCEEAVYKHIMYGVLSTRSNIPEYIVQRYKKERFAETRKAKIRLSNIKIEEFTQVLKGMSKQIK